MVEIYAQVYAGPNNSDERQTETDERSIFGSRLT